MLIENMPFCCTSAVLGSLGEHGEPSVVTVEEIRRLVDAELRVFNLSGKLREERKRCVLAISVDPKNIRTLLQAGFKIVDRYKGIQGIVHIMTFHAGNPRGENRRA